MPVNIQPSDVFHCFVNILVPVSWNLAILVLTIKVEAAVRAHGKRKGLSEDSAAMYPIEYHI